MTINDLFAYLLIGFALFYSNNVILALLFNKLNTSNIKIMDDVKLPLLVLTNIIILSGILFILITLIIKLFNSI